REERVCGRCGGADHQRAVPAGEVRREGHLSASAAGIVADVARCQVVIVARVNSRSITCEKTPVRLELGILPPNPGFANIDCARRLTYGDPHMRDLLFALLHLAVVTAKLCGSGGVRAVIAENLVLKQQLIVLRRARRRAPNLTRSDRLLCGLGSLFLSPGRIRKVAIALRPSTLLAFHQ